MNRRQQEILERIKERDEIKYRVKFGEGIYLERGWLDNLEDVTIDKLSDSWVYDEGKEYTIFTENEIKSIDKRYWQFREEVLENELEKTYRFEISGFCEIDVDATSMEEAEQKCEEAMKEIFDKDLFTDYHFVEEVQE